jgi:hypothetical protein
MEAEASRVEREGFSDGHRSAKRHCTSDASQGLNILVCSAAWLYGVWDARGPRANAIMAHLFGHLR